MSRMCTPGSEGENVRTVSRNWQKCQKNILISTDKNVRKTFLRSTGHRQNCRTESIRAAGEGALSSAWGFPVSLLGFWAASGVRFLYECGGNCLHQMWKKNRLYIWKAPHAYSHSLEGVSNRGSNPVSKSCSCRENSWKASPEPASRKSMRILPSVELKQQQWGAWNTLSYYF